MPQPEDSGGHPHPHPDGCFMLASVYVKTLAIRNKLISKLYQLSGHTVAPTAYRILCVRFTSFVRQHDTSGSAVGATLDMGGWLALSRPGLSPGKMRQACLGATTTALSGAPPRMRAKRALLISASALERAVRCRSAHRRTESSSRVLNTPMWPVHGHPRCPRLRSWSSLLPNGLGGCSVARSSRAPFPDRSAGPS